MFLVRRLRPVAAIQRVRDPLHDLTELFGSRQLRGVDDRLFEFQDRTGAFARVRLRDHGRMLTRDLTRRERFRYHRELPQLRCQLQRRVRSALGETAFRAQRGGRDREALLGPLLRARVLLDRSQPRELQLVRQETQCHDVDGLLGRHQFLDLLLERAQVEHMFVSYAAAETRPKEGYGKCPRYDRSSLPGRVASASSFGVPSSRMTVPFTTT
jgi:hypothetical protein